MKIIKFDKKYADQMARLHNKCYSEPGAEWDLKTSKESIAVCYNYYPEVCFMAVNDKGECMGAIFNIVSPFRKGNAIFLLSIQVEPEYRRKGVATALIKKTIGIAEQKELTGIFFNTYGNKKFPKQWYEKLGFKRTGFIEYYSDIENIKA